MRAQQVRLLALVEGVHIPLLSIHYQQWLILQIKRFAIIKRQTRFNLRALLLQVMNGKIPIQQLDFLPAGLATSLHLQHSIAQIVKFPQPLSLLLPSTAIIMSAVQVHRSHLSLQ